MRADDPDFPAVDAGAAARWIDAPGLHQERAWRRPPALYLTGDDCEQLLVTRWRDPRQAVHRQEAPATECPVVALCLESVSVRIRSGAATMHAGALMPGAMFLAPAEQPLAAEFDGPCDFLHIYLPPAAWRRRATQFWSATATGPGDGIGLARDGLAEQLARSLLKAGDAGHHAYGQAVADAIVARYLLLTRAPRESVHRLQRWRLRRVQAHVEANLAEPLRLADLAGLAGLSRMHFAAQFRAATGYRPHEYLLWRRIERAKAMLRRPEPPVVQVALAVGFQAQAHFTTVFKRLTGETPASWRTSQRAEATLAVSV